MTEFEAVLISKKFGNLCRVKIEAEKSAEALCKMFKEMWYERWYVCHNTNRTHVLLIWETEDKNGRKVPFARGYTCQQLNRFEDIYNPDKYDLLNTLIGLEYALRIYDIKKEEYYSDELYDGAGSFPSDVRKQWWYIGIPQWIHTQDEKENKKEFLKRYGSDFDECSI